MAFSLNSYLPAGVLLRGVRTTILQSLGWAMLLFVLALVGLSIFRADLWLLLFFAALLCITFVTFIGTFVAFAKKDPDALRSEKFVIDKMAIAHGVYGDSQAGIIDAEYSQVNHTPTLAPNRQKEITAIKTGEET